MSFAVNNYPQGYTSTNPFEYTLGEEMTLQFIEGPTAYYCVNVTNAGTYKLQILSISDSNSKTIEVYNSDMTVNVGKVEASAASELYIENLAAGTYVIKAYNTSANYNSSFVAMFSEVEIGQYWSTAEQLTLTSDMTLNAGGTYYYQFTTAEKLWYFFSSDAKVEVYDASKKLVGTSGIQLAENTTYYLVVTQEAQTVTVTYSTLVEYADGKSPAGAFTYSEVTKVLSLAAASYQVYYKITVSETGTYRFYTNNNGSLDTKGYLYDDVACSSYIKYNDDAGSSNTYVGYRYDFYFEYELVAGVEYYVKVTYTVYSSNTATSLTFNFENTAN